MSHKTHYVNYISITCNFDFLAKCCTHPARFGYPANADGLPRLEGANAHPAEKPPTRLRSGRPCADTTEPRRGLAGAFRTRWRAIVEGRGVMDGQAHGLAGIE